MQRLSPILACFVIWLFLPLAISTSGTFNLFIFSFINLILAVGLALLFGYAGQISLGQAGFYGIGAYVSSWLATRAGLPPVLGIIAGTLAPAILGYVIGRPVLKLRGYYLAMVTAALGLILHTIFVEWDGVTGGYSGITGIPALTIGPLTARSPLTMYYVSGACAFIVLFLSLRLVDTAYGRAMRTMRESEAAAKSVGIGISSLKAEVFALSAGLSGLAGGLYAQYVGFISPESFTIDASVNLLLALVIGGVGSLWGAAVGAILLTFMPEWFHQLQNAYGLVLGALVVVLLTLEPRGLIGIASRLTGRFSRPRLKPQEA
jgi:branched-chain amino acid transport system permease protein